MSRKQRERRDEAAATKASSSKMLRWLVPLLIVLAVLAVGLNVCWRLTRPQLDVLPVVESESLDPKARALIQGALAKVNANDFSAKAWGDLGAILRAHDLAVPAEAAYRNAERLDGADYRWPYLLGVSLAPTDAEQALACFRRAAERCGDQPHVQMRLAEMLLERRLNEAAAVLVDKVLAYAPSNARGQLARARLLFADGKMEEAKSWAEQSAAGAPDRRAPHLLLAQLCRRTGDKEGEARELAILEQIPDGITPWEDPDVAAVLALRQDPAGNSAALQLARSLNREKKFPAAEAAARAELTKFPRNERLYFELGIACFQQQKYQDALTAFSRVVQLKPDHADAHYNLGHAQLKLGKTEEARESFAAAVRLQPSHAFARINLADLLLQAGETREARKHLDVAARLAPDERRVHELLERAKQVSKN